MHVPHKDLCQVTQGGHLNFTTDNGGVKIGVLSSDDHREPVPKPTLAASPSVCTPKRYLSS